MYGILIPPSALAKLILCYTIGQSLISYLDSRSYDTGAQLDKENAHFSICEALITAIEQIRCQKWNSVSDYASDKSDESSDEEIKSLKEKLRDRR